MPCFACYVAGQVWPYCSSAAAPPPLQACTARRLLLGRSIIIITIINLIFHVVDIFSETLRWIAAQRLRGDLAKMFVGL